MGKTVVHGSHISKSAPRIAHSKLETTFLIGLRMPKFLHVTMSLKMVAINVLITLKAMDFQ